MTRVVRLLAYGVVLAAGAAAFAATRIAEPARPFLWKVERPGQPTAWLFGTIHVPDARVQVLPAIVRRAFHSADRLVTEIPLDAAAQLKVSQALLLPENVRLRDVLGQTRFDRLVATIRAAVGDEEPHVGAAVVGAVDRLEPWAALAQLALVEYLPDLLAGRPSLDARLHADAQAAGKALSALETVEEQAGVFDAFTREEQIVLLDTALNQADTALSSGGLMPGRLLVDRYLSGDATALANALYAQAPAHPTLARKFERALLHDRNTRMVERFESLRMAHPTEVLFVAVGTLHLVGDASVPMLLKARGYRVTGCSS